MSGPLRSPDQIKAEIRLAQQRLTSRNLNPKNLVNIGEEVKAIRREQP